MDISVHQKCQKSHYFHTGREGVTKSDCCTFLNVNKQHQLDQCFFLCFKMLPLLQSIQPRKESGIVILRITITEIHSNYSNVIDCFKLISK